MKTARLMIAALAVLAQAGSVHARSSGWAWEDDDPVQTLIKNFVTNLRSWKAREGRDLTYPITRNQFYGTMSPKLEKRLKEKPLELDLLLEGLKTFEVKYIGAYPNFKTVRVDHDERGEWWVSDKIFPTVTFYISCRVKNPDGSSVGPHAVDCHIDDYELNREKIWPKDILELSCTSDEPEMGPCTFKIYRSNTGAREVRQTCTRNKTGETVTPVDRHIDLVEKTISYQVLEGENFHLVIPDPGLVPSGTASQATLPSTAPYGPPVSLKCVWVNSI